MSKDRQGICCECGEERYIYAHGRCKSCDYDIRRNAMNKLDADMLREWTRRQRDVIRAYPAVLIEALA